MFKLLVHTLVILIIFTPTIYASDLDLDEKGFRHLAELNQKMEEDDSGALEKVTTSKPHSAIFEDIYPTVVAQKDKKPNEDPDVATFGKVIQAAISLEDTSFEEDSSNKKIVTAIDSLFLLNRSVEEFKKYTLWLKSIIDTTQGVDLLAFQDLLVKSKYIDDLSIVIGQLKTRPLLEKPNIITSKNFQNRFKSRFKSKFLEEDDWIKNFYQDDVILTITFLRQINSPLDYQYFSHQFLDIILNLLKMVIEIDMEYEKFLADNYQNTDESNRYKNVSSIKNFSESHAYNMSLNLLKKQHETEIKELKAEIKKIKADCDKKLKNQQKQANRQKEQSQICVTNILNQKQSNDLKKVKQLEKEVRDHQNQLKQFIQQITTLEQNLEDSKITQHRWQSDRKKLEKTLKEQSFLIKQEQEKVKTLENEKNQSKYQRDQDQIYATNLSNQKQYNDLEKVKQLEEQLKDSQNQLKEVINERNQQQKTLEIFQKSQRKWQAQEKHLKKTLEEKSCLIHDAIHDTKEKIETSKNEKNQATEKANLLFQDPDAKYQKLLANYQMSQNLNQELQIENQTLRQGLVQSKGQPIIDVSPDSLPEETTTKDYGFDNTILRFKLAQARDKLEEINRENQVMLKTLGHVYNRYVPSLSYQHSQIPSSDSSKF